MPGNKGLKGYELKDSFMGGGEAGLVRWMRFKKMGVRVEVDLAGGSSVTSAILPGAAAREFIEEHDIERKDKRTCLIVRRADNDYDIVP